MAIIQPGVAAQRLRRVTHPNTINPEGIASWRDHSFGATPPDKPPEHLEAGQIKIGNFTLWEDPRKPLDSIG